MPGTHQLVARKSGNPAYRAGVTLALAASFLLAWVNLVAGVTGNQDNPVNFGFFVLVLAPAVSAFAVRGRAEGMARAMLGVAAMQAILTALAVTAPSTANSPRGIAGVMLLSGYFAALWLGSAAAFWQAARKAEVAAAAS